MMQVTLYITITFKSWSPNNTSSNIPRWQYGDLYYTAKSDRFWTNAGYFNFQSFTVGYTLPKGLIPMVSKIRVYCAGENLVSGQHVRVLTHVT